MIKRILKLLLVFVFFFLLVLPAKAVSKQVKVYFFWAQSCPHCAREKIFLENLSDKYPQIKIESLDIGKQENVQLWKELGKKLNISIGATPFTVVGDRYFVGYMSDETSGSQIEAAVNENLNSGCIDILDEPVDGSASSCESKTTTASSQSITLPILGKVIIKDLSLPLLTLVMGLLDGFNPCAMWTLLFLISLLLGMKDRKRMWTLGVAFIITSSFVYFLFLAAWLNFFLLIGFILWARIIIGLIAMATGGYSLRDYFVNRSGGCEVVADTKRRQVFERIRAVTQKKKFIFALGGIILLALVVNLVELVCSAGLPAIYTQVLSLNKLPSWQYYLYLLGYIFFFMIDDLFVFFTAMITLKAVGIESKYARFSRLFGGIIMVGIGILLLFRPEWLMFG